ncbi:MAG TPA: multiubiquitin domain-containing protein [Bacteroidia bacterium]|nr:multiubiquitin domain-containing protein [Bacteroidia bacterium]
MKNNNSNSQDEIIDVEAYTKADKKPPVGKKYKVKIDNEFFVFNHHIVTGREILETAGKKPTECHTLYQKYKHCDFEKIDLDEKVDLAKPGVEHFIVKPPLVFNYTVDEEPETTDKMSLTANQILELAGLKAADHYLVLINPDGSQLSYKDNPTTPIEMKCPGLKFISVFRGEVPVSFKN